MQDAEEAIKPALGSFVKDYDVTGIAREYLDVYDEHDGFSASSDGDASDEDRFWDIVRKHDVSD